jgi:hypothetical protein
MSPPSSPLHGVTTQKTTIGDLQIDRLTDDYQGTSTAYVLNETTMDCQLHQLLSKMIVLG